MRIRSLRRDAPTHRLTRHLDTCTRDQCSDCTLATQELRARAAHTTTKETPDA